MKRLDLKYYVIYFDPEDNKDYLVIINAKSERETKLIFSRTHPDSVSNIKSIKRIGMNTLDYPIGSDTKDAPFNQIDNPEKEIEVLVSLTLSKSFKIKLDNYKVIKEEYEGEMVDKIDLSDVNLEEIVREQYCLPDMVSNTLNNICNYTNEFKDTDKVKECINSLIEDLSLWNVDEIEVIEDK